MSVLESLNLETIRKKIKTSNNPVVVTGAGISTLSGIPDYSSMEGLYIKDKYYNPRQILSTTFFDHNRIEFINWFEKTFYKDYKENEIHKWTNEQSVLFPHLKIINQNVDGFLNQAINFHGNSKEWKCKDCEKIFEKEEVKELEYVCNGCRGYLRPNIVLYNESINETNFKLAKKILLQADFILILGTSLEVHPLSNLVLERLHLDTYWIDKYFPSNYWNNQDIKFYQADFKKLFNA